MRYMIIGARKDNGEDITLYIDASTQERAETKAMQRGVLVAAISPITGAKAIPSMDDGKVGVAARMAAKPRTPTITPLAVAVPAATPSADSPTPPLAAERLSSIPTKMPRWTVLAAVIVLVPATVLSGYFFLVFKPQYEATRDRLREAVVQAEKTEEMRKKSDETMRANYAREIAEASGHGIPTAEAVSDSADVAKAAKQKRLSAFASSCEPFVSEAKSIQAMIQEGLTFAQYRDEITTLVKARAQFDAAPDDDDAKYMVISADTFLRKHQLAFKVWDTGLSVKGWPYQRDLQAQWESANATTESVVNALETIRSKLD